VKFEQASEEQLITDEKELAAARAGADWHCGYCGTRNAAGTGACAQCGADQKEGKVRESGQVVGAQRAEKAAEILCPACGSPNPADAQRCAKCGVGLAQKAAPVKPAAPAAGGNKFLWLWILGGLMLLCLCGVGVYFLTRTTETTGKVTSVKWERSIVIEQLLPVEKSGWKSEIPSDAKLGACEMKVHHTQDAPEGNSPKVCGTPYSVDKGNGYSEIVKDCYYEIKQDFCKFTVKDWKEVDKVKSNGSDFSPRWPALNLKTEQREKERDESYQVMFDSNGKSLKYTTSDFNKYKMCTIGSEWKLQVNTFDAVVSFEPLK
jgi:hypothetical protein